MAKRQIAVVGFPKCGTMSLVDYLKKEDPTAEISRPENIYISQQRLHKVEHWHEWECYAITRNPLDRIKSGIRYFTQLRTIPIQNILTGNFKQAKNYENVGFRHCIQQSNYKFYVERFQKRYGARVEIIKFEDLKGKLPHVNKTESDRIITKDEERMIKEALEKAHIYY